MALDDQSEFTSSVAVISNNVREGSETEQVSSDECGFENYVDYYYTQDSGLEASEVAETDDLNNNYHQLDQELNRHPTSIPHLSNEYANTCSISSTKDCDKKEVVVEKKKKEISKENGQNKSESNKMKDKRKGKLFVSLFNCRRALIGRYEL